MPELEPGARQADDQPVATVPAARTQDRDFPVVKNRGPDPASPGSEIIEVDGRPVID